jgi:threonine aldolase
MRRLTIDREAVQTNIVYLEIRAGASRAAQLVDQLDALGIKVLAVGPRVRLVTSLNVNREDVHPCGRTD